MSDEAVMVPDFAVVDTGKPTCMYECGRPVSHEGYACDTCSEERLPLEHQRREGDTVLLIRKRRLKIQGSAAESAVLLRPKHQEEMNERSKERFKSLRDAATLIYGNVTFSRSAEGKEFWLAIYGMLLEKAEEFKPK